MENTQIVEQAIQPTPIETVVPKNAEKLAATQQWLKESFEPWKEARMRYEAEQNNQIIALRTQKVRIQYLVGLLLNGQYDRAVKGWNQLGLEPKLQTVTLDNKTDSLIFTTSQGQRVESDINALIKEMQEVLAG